MPGIGWCSGSVVNETLGQCPIGCMPYAKDAMRLTVRKGLKNSRMFEHRKFRRIPTAADQNNNVFPTRPDSIGNTMRVCHRDRECPNAV
ncbi:hypothetical protein AA100600_2605 [Gluconobacter thailandicus F149-1 = NBRC 100600]|nr:hypothetical protein AA100600_2605 [Gluconobacter thailandicus F149-1 = NBRC 100600]